MRDLYLPPNLGNGPAFVVDNLRFDNEWQARRYIVSLGGWNDAEARAYLQHLYDNAKGSE